MVIWKILEMTIVAAIQVEKGLSTVLPKWWPCRIVFVPAFLVTSYSKNMDTLSHLQQAGILTTPGIQQLHALGTWTVLLRGDDETTITGIVIFRNIACLYQSSSWCFLLLAPHGSHYICQFFHWTFIVMPFHFIITVCLDTIQWSMSMTMIAIVGHIWHSDVQWIMQPVKFRLLQLI